MRTLLLQVLILQALLGCDSLESSSGPDGSSTEENACPDLEASARTLLESAQSCTSAADCVFVSLDVECVPEFLCDLPVSVETDRERLEQRARALSVDYQSSCGCSHANCAPRDAQELRCTAGRCESVRATADEDAG